MDVRIHVRAVSAAAVLALFAAAPASAQLITSQAGPGNFVFAGFQPLPNMTTAPFFNAANQRFVVTFSAECAVNAAAGDYVANTDVDVVVLDAATGEVLQELAQTSGNTDVFCSANGTAGFDGWARNSVTVVGGLGLAAGFIQVRVRARTNGAFQAWYGDRALVVTR
jgi:hypothetical protein